MYTRPLTPIANNAASGFQRFPIKCTNDKLMTHDDVTDTYGESMATARAKNRAIKNPSEKNSPEPKKPKAPKVETPHPIFMDHECSAFPYLSISRGALRLQDVVQLYIILSSSSNKGSHILACGYDMRTTFS